MLWKLRSEVEISIDFVDLNSVVFLATDFQEYQRLLMTSPSDFDKLLTFQKPVIYDGRVSKKKPAIGHCVHMVRDLNKRRLGQMTNWLNMQQRLGIDAVKLYFYKVEKNSEEEMRSFIANSSMKMIIDIVNVGLVQILINMQF